MCTNHGLHLPEAVWGGGGEGTVRQKVFPETMGIAIVLRDLYCKAVERHLDKRGWGQGFGDHKLLGLLLCALPAALQSRRKQSETARTAKKTLLLGEIS